MDFNVVFRKTDLLPPAYISFFHPCCRSCPVIVLVVATTVPSRCICKIFIARSSRAFNILEILKNKQRQSSLFFEDQLLSPSSSLTFEKDETAFEKQSALFALVMWYHDISREQVANKPLLKTVCQTLLENLEPVLRENVQKVANLRQRFFHSIALGGLVEVGRSTVRSISRFWKEAKFDHQYLNEGEGFTTIYNAINTGRAAYSFWKDKRCWMIVFIIVLYGSVEKCAVLYGSVEKCAGILGVGSCALQVLDDVYCYSSIWKCEKVYARSLGVLVCIAGEIEI
uniref:Uncharacterized protein n=1 Tax=Cucumis melo TaxID=3656 RepID=A0A9I9EKP9_CUCME